MMSVTTEISFSLICRFQNNTYANHNIGRLNGTDQKEAALTFVSRPDDHQNRNPQNLENMCKTESNIG